MLTATGRLARHLRWRAGIELKRAGAAAWPSPDILSLRAWLERQWGQSLVSGGEAGSRLLLTDAQFRHVSRGIIDELTEARLSGAGIERLVRKARTLCANWSIGPHDLRAAANSPDTEFFAQWAERFTTICTDHAWVDAAGLSELLLPELGALLVQSNRRIVLAGFEYPAAAETRLFAKLDELGELWGQLVTAAPAGSTGYQLRFDTPADERCAAAGWARAQLEAQPDALIGIVVPDLSRTAGAYRRDFLDAIDPHWRERDNVTHPVSIIDGRCMADCGMVRTAQLLLRVPFGKLEFTELGQLLRSPFVGDWQHEIDARARFDLSIRNNGLQTISLHTLRKRFSRPDNPGPVHFLELIERLLGLTELTRGGVEPSAWVRVIDQLLDAAGFCRGRPLGGRDERVLRQWTRLLEEFSSLGEVTGRISYHRALALLDEAAREQQVEVAGRDDGVQFLTPAETQGYQFDAVWVCGMTSAGWPGDSRPSPLLPVSLQRDRGIPAVLPDVYRSRSLDQLRRVLTGTPISVASWPAQDGEETLLASPHIAHLVPVRPNQFGIDENSGRFGLQPLALAVAIDDEAPPVAAGERIRGGSRLLTLQSVCPARAFFELRLGAREMPVPPFALDALTRGSLVHHAAEYLYRELGAEFAVASAVTVEAALATAIGQSLDRCVPPMHPLAETLRATETIRLERLLRNLLDYDQRRGNINSRKIEVQEEISVGDVKLTVRFDRVDVDAEAGQLVVDYKTGAKFSASRWSGERPLDMQMPLYAAFGEFDGIALYWMHRSKVSVTGLSDRDWGTGRSRSFRCLPAQEWQEQVADWRDICERLVAEFRDGDCRIDLANDGSATGEYAMLTRRWALRADPQQDLS